MITQSDIIEGAKFTSGNGIVWVIDKVEGGLVSTSMQHGKKGNYRDPIETVVEFLNEQNAEKL